VKVKTVFISALVATLLGTASTAGAEQVLWERTELLRDFFPQSERVTYKQVELDDALRARLEARLGYGVRSKRHTIFIGLTGKTVDGYAVFGEELGQHLPITFAVKLSPTGVIDRQEVVVYREAYGHEITDRRFRRQFVGKTPASALSPGADIAVVTGATISCRSMARGVRRLAILVDEVMLDGRHRVDGPVSSVVPAGASPTPGSGGDAAR
jgi:electron transport complex protein RnfG